MVVVVACLLPGLFFWQGLFSPVGLIREDAASYFQPYYTFAADEVRAGRLPLWNPYTLLGIPYHAGLQAALFYPLRWPLFWMPYVPGYVFLVWTHYTLTLLAAYLLLRLALSVGPLAALLGAISIAYGGFAQGHLSHLPYFLGYPWFLLCLLCVWRAAQGRQWRWTIAGGVCAGLLSLIGAVHLLLILVVLLGTFVAFHSVCELVNLLRRRGRQWPSVFWPSGVVAGTVVLGGLLGAVQLLPARELTNRSVRETPSWEFINMACAHPVRNSLQLVAPFYYGNDRLGYWGEYNYHDMAHYVGAVILLAAIVGLLHLGKDRYLWFLVVLAIVGFLVGAGKYLPVYRWFYDVLPGFGQLRNPTRIFWCTDIALACLAALGIDRTLHRSPGQRVPAATRWINLLSGAALLLVLGIALWQLQRDARDPQPLLDWLKQNPNVFKDMWYPGHVAAASAVPRRIVSDCEPAAWANILAAVIAAVWLPWLIARRGRIGPLAGTGLVLLLTGDLFALSFGMVQYETIMRVTTEPTPRVRWLQEHLGDQRFTVWSAPGLPDPNQDDVIGNRPMLFRLRSVQGTGGGILDLPDRLRFGGAMARYPRLASLAGVRYVLADRESANAELRPVQRDNRYLYYENSQCRPLAYLVHRLLPVRDPKLELPALLSEQFDPNDMAVVADEPPPETALSRAAKFKVNRMNSVPGRWEIETETDAPMQLVVLEGFDAGWRCRINDRPVPILRTNYTFMSVPVPAGSSNVVLEYAPSAFRQGLWLSAAGLLFTVGLALAHKKRLRT